MPDRSWITVSFLTFASHSACNLFNVWKPQKQSHSVKVFKFVTGPVYSKTMSLWLKKYDIKYEICSYCIATLVTSYKACVRVPIYQIKGIFCRNRILLIVNRRINYSVSNIKNIDCYSSFVTVIFRCVNVPTVRNKQKKLILLSSWKPLKKKAGSRSV
jgi:hypothetical protein